MTSEELDDESLKVISTMVFSLDEADGDWFSAFGTAPSEVQFFTVSTLLAISTTFLEVIAKENGCTLEETLAGMIDELKR